MYALWHYMGKEQADTRQRKRLASNQAWCWLWLQKMLPLIAFCLGLGCTGLVHKAGQAVGCDDFVHTTFMPLFSAIMGRFMWPECSCYLSAYLVRKPIDDQKCYHVFAVKTAPVQPAR